MRAARAVRVTPSDRAITGRGQADPLLDRQAQFDRHQAVHAELRQRAVRQDGVGGHPHDAGDLLRQQRRQLGLRFLRRAIGEQRGQVGGGAAFRPARAHGGEHRRLQQRQPGAELAPADPRQPGHRQPAAEQHRQGCQRLRRPHQRLAQALGQLVRHAPFAATGSPRPRSAPIARQGRAGHPGGVLPPRLRPRRWRRRSSPGRGCPARW